MAVSRSAKSVGDPVLVVGAGPAGLAVAGALCARGICYLLLEATHDIGHAWRHHYARLKLHTPKKHSSLPGFAWPDNAPRYPTRQQVVDYLEAYARHFQIQPHFDQRVTQALQIEGQWQVTVQNSAGVSTAYQAPVLVVATGYNCTPNRPTWPEQAHFQGQILHSSQYFSGANFQGQRVLVVGLGNSGGEIALDLHEQGAQPTLSVRGPVNLIPKEVLGTSYLDIALLQQHWPAWLADAFNAPAARLLIGDMERYGLRKPPMGPARQIRSTGRVPLIDIGTVAQIKAGNIQVRPAIARFTPQGVVFANGREEPFDAVVLATGFRPNVHDWLHLPQAQRNQVLDDAGVPRHNGLPTGVPGLFFTGFYVSPTGMLREIALEAKRIAATLAHNA